MSLSYQKSILVLLLPLSAVDVPSSATAVSADALLSSVLAALLLVQRQPSWLKLSKPAFSASNSATGLYNQVLGVCAF